MDPNAYGYVDMLDVINPSSPVSWTTLPTTLYGIVQGEMKHGKGATKRAAVCGNYHFPKTIFYGGVEQQASGALLQQFLSEHLDFKQLKQVGVVDVHTGLGPPGFDTLLLNAGVDSKQAKKIFAGGNVAINGEEDDEAAKGYDGVAGLLCSGMSWFLPSHVQSVCLTQEFGTASGLVVMKALIEENAMFHHAPSRRLPYAQKLRDAFYLHKSYKWKSDLIERGLRVFDQLQAHVASVA